MVRIILIMDHLCLERLPIWIDNSLPCPKAGHCRQVYFIVLFRQTYHCCDKTDSSWINRHT